ncbi:OLC1v1001994C1 [Oldenlandia corymbosa var. corymbosa]|uniref:OLC1v1001994C1 n=1 Tax=Oldenlandia corymbosa var. corymbosa TaxID=529605 RepID=A0AAV1D6K9_OLDCO|nr:OLC1v1001994C1 [Oldenlandia corymbosa var. corymbosa]
MEVEKRSSKGGFLQLFDWNVKSRKKLFSNKSESSENTKQGREILNDSTVSRLQKVHENGYGPCTRGTNDLNYTSSVNGDDGSTKAPSVVARLMGLDSLPTTNASESCYTPLFESPSFRDSHYSRVIPDIRGDEHIVIYESMRNKLDGSTKNPVEVMLHKVQSRPIERFQTEVLPPKSAKPISITHHKLLSPIKSPGFIPSMNAAYLVEAAAKIIEQSPRSTTTHKLPTLGSSSVPLRIQDLKEKMEAAQRSARILEASQNGKEQISSRQMKRQPRDKVLGRGEAPDTVRVLEAPKSSGPRNLKNKDKSVSMAAQAKANPQKKEKYNSGGNRNFVNQKEQSDKKYSSAARNQSKSQKSAEGRTSVNRPSDVLRPNSQKQNSGSNDDRESLRSSFSHQKDRKSVSTNDVPRSSKTVSRVDVNTAAGSRKTSVNLVGKEQPMSMMRKSAGKRPLVNGNNDRNTAINKGVKSVKCNFETEKYSSRWDAAERKSGMDVVSFTFTSPIKKSLSASSSPGHGVEKKRSPFTISSFSESQSSLGLSVTSSDALGMLLEQKLKELTSKIESPHQQLDHSSVFPSSADSCSDSSSALNIARTKSGEHDVKFQSHTPKDKPHVSATRMWQGVEGTEENGSIGSIEYDRGHRLQTARPVPSLEHAYSEASCSSLDSSRSVTNEASKMFSSFEAYEITQWSSTKKSQPTEDVELSDCASSASLGTTSVTETSLSCSSMFPYESPNWEFEYVRHVLVNTDLMLQEFALGEAHKILPPDLFVHFGDEKLGSNRNSEENFKVVRKLLFDYVEESLEQKCARLLSGSWKSWAKLTNSFQRKDWLAEGLCREISGWTSMEDFMVDELVDKDMSSHLGKWVDFETEAFEEGVDIEKGILSCLVDELVDDFLLA